MEIIILPGVNFQKRWSSFLRGPMHPSKRWDWRME